MSSIGTGSGVWRLLGWVLTLALQPVPDAEADGPRKHVKSTLAIPDFLLAPEMYKLGLINLMKAFLGIFNMDRCSFKVLVGGGILLLGLVFWWPGLRGKDNRATALGTGQPTRAEKVGPISKLCLPPARRLARQKARKRRILLTGDSMGDGLFVALRKIRQANNAEISYAPWYGSTSTKWAAETRLQTSIAEYQPDLVIFTLGANELFTPVSPRRVGQVKSLITQFGTAEYIWVGPPNWKPDWGTDSLFQAHVGSAHYFVSKNLILDRRRDGAHPTAAASEEWARIIVDWINQNPNLDFKFYHQVDQVEANLQHNLQGTCF